MQLCMLNCHVLHAKFGGLFGFCFMKIEKKNSIKRWNIYLFFVEYFLPAEITIKFLKKQYPPER